MIQIRKSNLEELVQNHYDKLNLKIKDDFPLDYKYSLETILKAKPKKLDEIVKWFYDLDDKQKEKYKYINTSGYGNFSNKKKEYNAYDLAKSLNISACPYCNRNYTFTVIKDSVGGGNAVVANGVLTEVPIAGLNSVTITARGTLDQDADGLIDGILMTASAALNDNFAGFTATVTGHVVGGYTTGTANDTDFIINIDELPEYYTKYV